MSYSADDYNESDKFFVWFHEFMRSLDESVNAVKEFPYIGSKITEVVR